MLRLLSMRVDIYPYDLFGVIWNAGGLTHPSSTPAYRVACSVGLACAAILPLVRVLCRGGGR